MPETAPPSEVYAPPAVVAVPTKVILPIAAALSNLTVAAVTEVPDQSICQYSEVETLPLEYVPPEPELKD